MDAYRLKVLLADDNLDFLYLLGAIVKQLGHSCISACDGPTAIKKTMEWKPDLIFCDIGLPGIDGFMVAKTIKQNPEMKKSYVVALTGYAGEHAARRTAESGFDFYRSKPVSIDDIKQILAVVQTSMATPEQTDEAQSV